MEQYIIYVIDTETTGLDPLRNEIIELSAFRFSLDKEFKGEQKTWLVKAKNIETIEDEALKVSGHKREDIINSPDYIEPAVFAEEFELWVGEDDMSAHDRVFGAQNASFDFGMMEATWKRLGITDTFPFLTGGKAKVLDTKQITLLIDVLVGKKRDRYNLSSLVDAFGVKKGKAHRADEDTRMTKDLLVKMIDGLRDAAKEKFSDCY